MSTFLLLADTEKEIILNHIKETLDVIEYPTSLIFSSLARLSIISYLRGRGSIDATVIESAAVDIFRQLSEYAAKIEKYRWFDRWAFRMIKTSKERKVHTG